MQIILLSTQGGADVSRVRQLLRLSGLQTIEGTILDFPALASGNSNPLVLVTNRGFVDCCALVRQFTEPTPRRHVWLTGLMVLEREQLAHISGATVLPLDAPIYTILGGLLGGTKLPPKKLLLGEVALDYESRTVETQNRSVQLTDTCFRFFRRLVYANGRYVHYLDLWEELWGDRAFTGRNALAVVATRTRQGLPRELAWRIQVRYGVGYRLMPPKQEGVSREE